MATEKAPIPSRLRRTFVVLHVAFWVIVVSLVVGITLMSAYERREMPMALGWVFLVFIFVGVLGGRVTFYVALWRLARGRGKSPILWVAPCLLTWPFGDVVAYLLMGTAPKEWAPIDTTAATVKS
jgi:hypothetical protein